MLDVVDVETNARVIRSVGSPREEPEMYTCRRNKGEGICGCVRRIYFKGEWLQSGMLF
jgi:hypothetical protein